ncbi:MAG TPA: cupredoxin domain-containing protein, partial [Patescibacteria group bacterium]|nr:cupredoxin domain-containing protein [Patescibacteria group bacterium]
HSFYVPAFLYQRDITPRKDQVIQFLADREGTYRGQCTQFCGLLHHVMEFEVVVESRAKFDAWLQEALQPPATPTPAAPGVPTPTPGVPTDGEGEAVVIEISAAGIAFDTDTLEVPANRPFQIVFANNDAGIPHNVAIHEGSPTGPAVWVGEIFNGIETRTYDVPALPAGTYGFICTVHPTMTGTLTAR